MLFNLYKNLFENDTNLFYFNDQWYPTDKDWEIMIVNMNNYANLKNIFKKVSTFNIDKMVRYYLVAKVIEWPGLDKYYNETLYQKFKKAGIFYDEMEIINDKFIEMPEQWKNLILDLDQYDNLGGVALRHQDMGDLTYDNGLFDGLKTINKYIKEIKFQRLPTDYGNFNPDQRIIKIVFNNDSIIYFKIIKYNSNSYYIKNKDRSDIYITQQRLKTLIQLYTYPYIHYEDTDESWVINNL